jgi:hypothetical protein
VDSSIDLSRYIQRRHFRSYERDMARSTYGYGVDLRRTRWLTTSVVGQAPLRALEHAWFALADTLMEDELRVPDRSSDIPLLSEVVEIARLLRTAPPAIRILKRRSGGPREWGIVTPLGDPRSSNEWLVLDLEALSRLPAEERAFLLGVGLGHLHCGHGALFLAHLVGHRRGGHRLLRGLLRPWTRVAAFSADRAGLLASGDLEACLHALELSATLAPAWSPKFPGVESRCLALQEFAVSTVAARFRTRRLREGHDLNLEEDLSALAEPPPPGEGSDDASEENPRPESSETVDDGADPLTDGVPDDAWTLTRCDHRLTKRLRLI